MSNNNLPAFVLDDNPTLVWPVTVQLPVAGGGFTDFRFEATYRLMSEEGFDELLANGEAKPEDAEKSATPLKDILANNARVLPQLVVGWTVKNAAGVPVPITDLPKTLTGPYGRALSIGLYRGLNEVRYGVQFPDPGANRGNSASSPAAGANQENVADATS